MTRAQLKKLLSVMSWDSPEQVRDNIVALKYSVGIQAHCYDEGEVYWGSKKKLIFFNEKDVIASEEESQPHHAEVFQNFLAARKLYGWEWGHVEVDFSAGSGLPNA